jgi:3-oxoacid CoA-transferase B subunit
MNDKHLIASRAAALLQPGWFVNLGIGIPTLVTHYVDADSICFQTENGLLGVGSPPDPIQVDPNLVDAAKNPVTERLGAAFFDSASSFGMIRGGHIDAVVLGALEVDAQGRVANWAIPGKPVLGVGGAMDLLVGARVVIVVMTHSAKDGKAKIVETCTLPLTTLRPVNWVVTELATFRVDPAGLVLTELVAGVTEDEVRTRTQARYTSVLTL